jgi:glycosyltransferase involved in cell wall biosynthesis
VPLNFGFIGTLSQAKGIEWLIDQYLKLDINATLIIGGRGDESYERKIKEKSKGANIKFLGFVDSQEFYSKIDVLIVPSIWPDTFRVAYEYSANNIPVIASNIGGLPEIIKDGVNGLLCDVNNEDSLGELMILLDSDRSLLNRLIFNCKASVNQLVTVDRMVQEYLDLFSDLNSLSNEK